jgi:V8-like Glu-specific endopeptidase
MPSLEAAEDLTSVAIAQAWSEARRNRSADRVSETLQFVERVNSKLLPERVVRPDVLAGWKDVRENAEFAANAHQLFELAQRDSRIRIVGGVETGEFPDCVAVGSATEWCCSGTLVGRNVVVTAGHCRPSCVARVFIGSDVGSMGEIVAVARIQRQTSPCSS